MSQAKVDRYKEEKKNRAKIMAKEKRNAMITRICGGVLCLALVGWAGFSAFNLYQNRNAGNEQEEPKELVSYTVNMEALEDYFSTLY